MIESYEEGQKLVAEDFISDLFFPSAKWDYALVEEVLDGGGATLRYVDEENELEDTVTWSKDEMEEMLGWNIDPNENVFDIQDNRDDQSEDIDIEAVASRIRNAHTADVHGPYELLDTYTPMFIKVENGRVRTAYIYSDDIKCIKDFIALKKHA